MLTGILAFSLRILIKFMKIGPRNLFSANLGIPNRHIIIRLNDKPLSNNDLRLAKRKKDRSHSKAKFSNRRVNWETFKSYHNKYCNMIKKMPKWNRLKTWSHSGIWSR